MGPSWVMAQPASDAPSLDSSEPVRLLLMPTLDRGPGPGLASAAFELLQNSLSRVEHILPVEARALVPASDVVPASITADLVRAENLLKKGRHALFHLEMETAVEALQSARVLLRRHLTWLSEPDLLIEALIPLAEALALSGDAASAEQAYAEVLSLVPDYQPDPARIPTRFITLFERVRERVRLQLGGRVTVETRPAGAHVFLDGSPAGETPCFRGLPPGLHFVRVEKDGFQTWRQVFEVKPGEPIRLQVALQTVEVVDLVRRLRRAVAQDDRRQESLALARRLLARARLTAVLLSALIDIPGRTEPVLSLALVSAKASEPRVMAVEFTREDRQAIATCLGWQLSDLLDSSRTPPAPDPALKLDFKSSLLGTIQPPVLPTGPLAAGPAVEPVADTPFWQRWWFFSGIGVVVVAAVVTAVLVADRGERFVYEPPVIRVRITREP